MSDAQWRNFRANLPILSLVFGVFTMIANICRKSFHFRARGMSILWLFLSLIYLSYLHGAWSVFLSILLLTAFVFFFSCFAVLKFTLSPLFLQHHLYPFNCFSKLSPSKGSFPSTRSFLINIVFSKF